MTKVDFHRHLTKVMRRKINSRKEWIEYNFEKGTIRFRSLIRDYEWNTTIKEFLEVNK